MQDEERVYGGRTLAQRKAERRAALLKATAEIVGESGTVGVTTRAVCERAGLIERYVYESFSSRDDLLRAAYDQALELITGIVLAEVARDESAPPLDRVRRTIQAALDASLQDRALLRLLLDVRSDPVLHDRADALFGLAGSMAEVAMGLLAPESVGGKKRQMRAEIWAAGVVALWVGWAAGRVDATTEAMMDVCVDMLQRAAAD